MSIRVLCIVAGLLGGCSSRQTPETVILKYTWVHCWNACGKKDNLAAVSSASCICTNGGVIPLQPQPVEPITEPSLFDKVVGYINGDGKS